MKDAVVRQLCFAQLDTVIEIAAVGRGLPTRLPSRKFVPIPRVVAPDTEAINRASALEAVQAAWFLSYEVGTCDAGDIPNDALAAMMARGDSVLHPARPSTAAVAKGQWILDSGASEHLIGKVNMTKRDMKEMSHDGQSVTLSTANGLVERRSRSAQILPEGTGDLGQVHALVMDEMDLNIVSMGKVINDKKFTCLWTPDHGLLWHDPVTRKWVRLKVENNVPILEPADDQSGIPEALRSVFGAGVEGTGLPTVVRGTDQGVNYVVTHGSAVPVVGVGPPEGNTDHPDTEPNLEE
ncbi:hypothetical protein, partial [uncultured Marinobacter sp.]|uniref:hypothetical protein n=1 Tax=uncultured Marinobacter sp. TaxID=187379 RepID=UPI002596C0DC